MSRRRVRPEELDLWNKVARSADPLHKARRADPLPKPSPKKPEPQPQTIPAFHLGQKAPGRGTTAPAPPPTTGDRLRAEPVQMDAKAFTRLKRGKATPEARIDLHGMTLDQAHPTLINFILTSQARNLRLVLVITGKGQREDPYDPMPRRRGVLRTQVPQWLRMTPIGGAVLQIAQAHRRHGGEGAFYVYLRRRR
ncbi:Smr/MutS family protein [Cognatishimia sp. F0-27]|uniref:Smr/MutS family protein n=1 Tax=Cognatishimia sp. F0-27 TaxID=2816855 RepID=UPI001D0C3E0E|nr:Smr/MutS family protein [Cognatishimia sp. F0-27]MCC1492442.1 Smr/MutS family protein [Cognatishimia sp. F0-27]